MRHPDTVVIDQEPPEEDQHGDEREIENCLTEPRIFVSLHNSSFLGPRKADPAANPSKTRANKIAFASPRKY